MRPAIKNNFQIWPANKKVCPPLFYTFNVIFGDAHAIPIFRSFADSGRHSLLQQKRSIKVIDFSLLINNNKNKLTCFNKKKNFMKRLTDLNNLNLV